MGKKVFPARMEHLEDMIDSILDKAREAGFDAGMLGKIRLAGEEALVNIIHYAYPGNVGEVEILSDFAGEGSGLLVEIADRGIPFNPLSAPPVDISAPVEARPIGGLGIHLIREIMDEVHYRRDQDRNILTLIKH